MADDSMNTGAQHNADLERFYADVEEVIARHRPVSDGFMLLWDEDGVGLEMFEDDSDVELLGAGGGCAWYGIDPKTGKKVCIKKNK